MCRAIAQASDKPSKVLVPRPISSIRIRLRAVALCRMFAASVISTMKVERPPARSSAAPMRVKMRSSGPITARSAGTIASHVREDHDERRLPHVGGLTTHVRAGDDQHPAARVEHEIVRHERAIRRSARRSGCRPAVIFSTGSLTSSGRVQSSAHARSARQASASSSESAVAVCCMGPRRSMSCVRTSSYSSFSRASARSRAPSTLSSKLLSSARDEALGGLHRLPAQVVLRHALRILARDLDEEALHAIETELQARDAAALALALLQLEQESVRVRRDVAQLVEVRVIALCDHVAVAQEGGGLGGNRASEQLGRVFVIFTPRMQILHAAGESMLASASRRAGRALSDTRSCMRSRGRAERSATRDEDSLHIADAAQLLAKAFEAPPIDERAEPVVATSAARLDPSAAD